MRGLDLTRGERRSSRRLLRPLLLAAALVTAALLLWWQAGPLAAFLCDLPRRVDRAVGNRLLPRYSAQLEARDTEIFALRNELATLTMLRQENDALRSLIQSGQAGETVWQTARVTALGHQSFTLTCSGAAAGQDVLTPDGRFAGVVRQAAEETVQVDAAGFGTGAVACTANGVAGYLTRSGEKLVLAGLPRHSGLAAGTPVTTATGRWVGQLAEAPTEDETGLNACAPLTDTAGQASLYFVAIG